MLRADHGPERLREGATGPSERLDMDETSVKTETIVEVKGLRFSYGEREVLRGVDFVVRRGEVFGLLGPNGGGKTTVFRVLSTLLPAGSGVGRIAGHDTTTDPVAVRRRIGVVFQSSSLDRKLSVLENLRHQGHLYGLRGGDLRDRIEDALERFGLADRRDERVEALSGGLARRVEIAKGLLHRPELLILDEPTSHLDPGVRRDLWDILHDLRESGGVTVVLTTHLMEEAERCDRIAILDSGRVIACGTPLALKREIGGDVIEVRSARPEELLAEMRDLLEVEPTLRDGGIRIEQRDGPALASRILERFPGRIESLTLGKPTLEDVFFRRTGRTFENGAGRQAAIEEETS